MIHLTHHFERICVLNLRDRPDRRQRLKTHLESFGVRENQIEWVRAYSGHAVPHPSWWNAGKGAWGCFLSHARVLAEALEDEVDSVLVLEDDVVFRDDIVELLEAFMMQLPDDWGQLYLGGQHWREPKPVASCPLVNKATGVYRTHAYAVHRRAMKEVFEHIWNVDDYRDSRGGWHIDHQFGLGHSRELWQTYAPIYWLAGQEAEWSNISGATNPRLWWHPVSWTNRLPFIWISSACPVNLEFAGQPMLVGDLGQERTASVDADEDGISPRLTKIAKLALSQEKLPALRWNSISYAELARCWTGPVIEWSPQSIRATWQSAYQGIVAELREAAMLRPT